MSESLRALVVILFLSIIFFKFVRPAAYSISGVENFTRRRNLWFALTIAAFLTPNFWVYTLFFIFLLAYARRHESNTPALFFFLLFALPMATILIPGYGIVQYVFALNHARILELFILLPAFFFLRQQNSTLPFGRTWPDKVFAAYLLFDIVLSLRGNS